MKIRKIKKGLAVALSVALTLSVASPLSIDSQAAKKKKVAYTTKSAVITQIWKIAGSPVISGKESFKDVTKKKTYYNAVVWAIRAGVIKDGTKFNPDNKVSRQLVANYFWKYACSPTDDSWKGYSDEKKVTKTYKKAVRWAKKKKVFKSIATKKFEPTKKVTKAQLKTIVSNYKATAANDPILLGGFADNSAPNGILLASDGTFFMTDQFSKQILHYKDGLASVYAGAVSVADIYGIPVGGFNDGSLTESFFKSPWALTPFKGGYAVSDSDNNALRLIADGQVKTINGSTSENLKTNKLGVVYDNPTGLTTDDAGNLYIADTNNGAIRKMSPDGLVTTFAKDLNDPMGLAYHNGAIYVAETSGNRILKISASGATPEVVAGSGEDGYADGDALTAEFSGPQGVALDSSGTIYVADTLNGAVRKIKNGKVSTILEPVDGMDLTSWPASPTQLVVYGSRVIVTDVYAKKVYSLKK